MILYFCQQRNVKCLYCYIQIFAKFSRIKKASAYVLRTVGARDGIKRTYVLPGIHLGLTLELLGSGGYQWLRVLFKHCPDHLLTLCIRNDTRNGKKVCTEWIRWNINVNTKQRFYRKFGIAGGN